MTTQTTTRVTFAITALSNYLGEVRLAHPAEGSPAYRDLIGAGLRTDGSFNVDAVGPTIARVQHMRQRLGDTYLSDRGMVMEWCRRNGLLRY